MRTVGVMTLDRNPTNFFAETEQVAFHPGHLVPGIGFVDDPLLHARLFSYLDTQLTRLGGPNFAQIPINRPRRTGERQQPRRVHAAGGARGRRAVHAELARRWMPVRRGRRRRLHPRAPTRSRARR